MKRSLLTLCVWILASLTLCFGAYRLAGRLCCSHLSHSADDLEWLRMEFRLSESELARVRQLHEGYLPRCRHFCEQIALQKRELEAALRGNPNPSPVAESKLAEIGALRAQCQVAMLRHFAEVSQVMPPEQGKRYLDRMQELTLVFHDQVEHRMAAPSAEPHEHH